MEDVNFDSLTLLLKASSKDDVVSLCQSSFLYRHSSKLPNDLVQSSAECLATEKKPARQLLHALSGLIKNALFQGSTQPAEVLSLFPAEFHKNLRDLLAKIIIEKLPSWKAQAVGNTVSLPKLVDFDWRVDVKTSSNAVSRMSVPTCLLQLQVQGAPRSVCEVPEPDLVTVELPRETLDTMLDGLGKIRDQLAAVAKTS